MASRLDRLFVLLETGSSASTRKAAAGQLGQVQRLHPHELPYLLQRVHKCLRSTSWETRIAGGQAVEAILAQVPVWPASRKEEEDIIVKDESVEDVKPDVKPDILSTKVENGNGMTTEEKKAELLSFKSFDVNRILGPNKIFLMASESSSFDDSCADPTQQRAMINKRLGLDMAEKLGLDTSDIVSSDDLCAPTSVIQLASTPVTEPMIKIESSIPLKNRALDVKVFDRSNSTGSVFSEDDDLLSSREINLQKRRARKMKSRDLESQSSVDDGMKKLKREDSVDGNYADFLASFNALAENDEWALGLWIDLLINDLFHSQWEVRHGAATALRECVKLHGTSGGRSRSAEAEDEHQQWLEDLALRMVCVLALDRFGDFVSDQVVAPVRETCSQCLGAVATLLSPSRIEDLMQILVHLLSQPAWEVRHGALLALKYIFAVRKDLVPKLLPAAFSSLFSCLSDGVDDVTAVAASALIPVAQELVVDLPEGSSRVVNVLWDSLANLDDLSSACNSIMELLATLLAFREARANLRDLNTLMPRLWPFLHHSSSSVRKSALLTLQKLTELDSSVMPTSTVSLQETLRNIYQRALVEHNADVLHLIPKVWSDFLKSCQLETLLHAACPLFGTWLCLAMHPPRVPLETAYLVSPKNSSNGSMRAAETEIATKIFMSGSGDGDPVRLAETRLILTSMLGELVPYIVNPLPAGCPGECPMDCLVRILLVYYSSRSALQRTVTSLVISAWPNPEESIQKYLASVTNGTGIPAVSADGSHMLLVKRLTECLNEVLYFDEIAVAFTRLQSDCRDFLATLRHYKVSLPPEIEQNTSPLFSFEQVKTLSGDIVNNKIQTDLRKSKTQDMLLDRRKSISTLCAQTTHEFAALNIMMMAAIAGAVCKLRFLPEKLNPVVKPLMESIKKEENELFQKAAADHLCFLMSLILDRSPSPIPKIVQNLTAFLCCDDNITSSLDDIQGIMSLANFNPVGENLTSPLKKMTKQEEQADHEAKRSIRVQRRGATIALTRIVETFGKDLPDKIPRLWELTFGELEAWSACEAADVESCRKVIDALQVLEVISPSFHRELFTTVEGHIGRICNFLGHRVKAVRHIASRCLAVWASLMPEKVMPTVVKEVLPLLGSMESHTNRQGGIEAVWCIVDKLALNLLPYIVLLVVPVLGRMSDQDESVRLLASLTFATLVRLMPLEGAVPDPPNLPEALMLQKTQQREFLEQLLNPTRIPDYKITVPINAELRPYQQAGVNWLGFLNKYKLHGILCDDMGLGKTLQSICILGSDHFNRQESHKIQSNPDNIYLPSIVICPPTLTGHWVYEIEKFIDREYLSPLHYHGPPAERNKLKPKVAKHNLVVASYDIVRNDIDFFSSKMWNYCILDEGHMIKNGKTKISKAIKQLQANHRLILSGTPIQNNVLELWSLFDFLMPGFLGTEKQFASRFAKPILMARDPKSSPKDQEAGALAMESLHRQALPFLLRRLKEDVLKDLPPKITQDYYCDLSPIQEQLYEDFARSRAHQSLRDTISASDDASKHSHIFQALQYLRKVCNHPKLVLSPQHPKYTSVLKQLADSKSSLNDIHHSAKLPALRQLLLDCGIGVSEMSSATNVLDDTNIVSPHRALIFCQLKVMLDILENDLFKTHMPSVTYLRLDGGVPAGQRHSLVTRFNNDPSIDVLLLTTQVGGLGLNLTGADTVIFVEHDWNPMRDLQAMDRAHRIGQKKVVNVYRLITRGTLEEKIMGLQKFKLMTANTIISQDNSCLETMATDQLLDLFVLEDAQQEERSQKRKDDVGGMIGAYKSVLEQIPELWEDELYTEEYDLSAFIRNLNR